MNKDMENILIRLLTEEVDLEEKQMLLDQLEQQPEAYRLYTQMSNMDSFVQPVSASSPSSEFTSGVMMSYDRLKTKHNNNRLIGYFLIIAVLMISGLIMLTGNSTAATASPIADQLVIGLDGLIAVMTNSSFIQLVMVLNVVALVVLIERIIMKDRMLRLYSFFLSL